MEVEIDYCGMVPARLSSIRSLGRKRVQVKDGGVVETCVVCLEELPTGTQVTSMPCSHTFHGDCITRWLVKSHLCPICRYEMPKASDNF